MRRTLTVWDATWINAFANVPNETTRRTRTLARLTDTLPVHWQRLRRHKGEKEQGKMGGKAGLPSINPIVKVGTLFGNLLATMEISQAAMIRLTHTKCSLAPIMTVTRSTLESGEGMTFARTAVSPSIHFSPEEDQEALAAIGDVPKMGVGRRVPVVLSSWKRSRMQPGSLKHLPYVFALHVDETTKVTLKTL
jgi:hypothetical protein